jgi:phospholipase/carboxylesterase
MLEYELIPARTPPRDRAAAWHCLVLHGIGDSMAGWIPVADELGLDELGFVFANAPQSYYGGFSWFDIAPDFSPDDDHVRHSRALLGELIDQLLTRLGIPAGHLFLMGFSQGSLMVMDTALREQRCFAGLVVISGFMTMLDEFPAAFGAAGKKQDILMTHGTDDPLIPIRFARQIKDRLVKLGVAIDWREYAKVHTLDPVRELPDIRAWLERRMRAGATPLSP